MNLRPPAQFFSTTLYDRYQPQALSFIFVPTRSLKNNEAPDLVEIWNLFEQDAPRFREITAASYLPAALASLLQATPPTDPFSWVDNLGSGSPFWIHPNSVGFAEYISFSEVIPFEESPLAGKSLMAIAVSVGAQIGLISGGSTPMVLITVPAGIIVCTATVVIGPDLGAKITKLMGV